MGKLSFNDGWNFGKKGGELVPVALPHDAMFTESRDENNPSGKNGAYFAGGDYEYVKTFRPDETWKDKRLILEFEGVYRNSEVYLNGEKLSYRPYGYINFYTNTGGTRLVKKSGKDGDLYYRQNTSGENYEVGVIGSGNYAGDNNYGGISFAVKPDGKYMGWFHNEFDDGNVYAKMVYYADDTYFSKGIHTYCDFYLGAPKEVSLQAGGVAFVVRPGGLEAFGNLNMNNYQITNQSDARLKENISDMSGGLEKVNAVNVYNFDWIDGEKGQTGFIAQQVQEEIPDAVIEKDGILNIAYAKLFPYLWQAVKELAQKTGVPYVRTSWRDSYTAEEKAQAQAKKPQPPAQEEPPIFTMEAKDDE